MRTHLVRIAREYALEARACIRETARAYVQRTETAHGRNIFRFELNCAFIRAARVVQFGAFRKDEREIDVQQREIRLRRDAFAKCGGSFGAAALRIQLNAAAVCVDRGGRGLERPFRAVDGY